MRLWTITVTLSTIDDDDDPLEWLEDAISEFIDDEAGEGIVSIECNEIVGGN